MPGRGRRRRSRTPPRRYSTEPLRPQTAPARTTTNRAVTAIAEADVRIPQALAQTQHRRTSSGGWFRSSRNRPVTAPPVAEIVLPTTTPVASVVTSHSFRRERDGSMSSYPAATCVGGDPNPALADARAAAAAAPPPAPAAAAPAPAPASTGPAGHVSGAEAARLAAARAPPANRGVALPGMAGAANAPPPPLSPATVDRHVASPPAPGGGAAAASRAASDLRLDEMMADTSAPPPLARSNSAAPPPLAPIAHAPSASGGSAQAPVAAPPLADGASGRWAMAGAGRDLSSPMVTPETPPLLTPASAAAAAPAPAPARPAAVVSSDADGPAPAAAASPGTAARDRPWTTYTGALTPGAASALAGAFTDAPAPAPAAPWWRGAAQTPETTNGPLTEARCAQLAAVARSAAAPDARTGALTLLGDASSDLGRAPAASALALALQSALFADDARVRAEALRTAAKCGLVEVARSVRGDDDVNVRREAARLLAAGAFGDDDVFRNDHTARRTFQKVAALASALRDKSIDEPGLVGQLEKALLKTGVRHERLLEAPLDRCLERHPSAAVRAAAATTAGALGCCECLRRLWLVQPDQTATRPEIVTVRVAAVNALARNGSSTTIRELAAADDLAEVRRAAYEWLARLDDAESLAERGLGDAVPSLRAAAACLLADVLLRRAANDAPTWQWRADAFPRPPPPAFEHAPRRLDASSADGFEAAASALIQAAQHDAEENVRGAALESLGRLRCVPGVAVGLEDASEASRLRAVELLEELAGDEAAAALERALDDPSTEVRRRATDALGRLEDPRDALSRVAVRDADPRVRVMTAILLGELKRPQALVETSLADPLYASVRAAAASSIGGLAAQAKEGDADAAAALDGLPLRQLLASRLGDADRSVRGAAAKALDVVEGGSWATIVRGDVNDVTRIHHAPGARATAVLVSLLCDAAEVDDRVAAAVALGGRDYDGAIPPLVVDALCACCAARGSLPAPLRVACLDALAALSVTAALDGSDQVDVACAHALEDAESVEVRRAAALCAGAAKCLSRGRLVHRVAEDPDPTVRIACAQSLREFGNEQGAAWALVAALGDGDARVREHAAASFDGFCGEASSSFRPAVARAVCARLLDRSDKEESSATTKRSAACRALRHLHDFGESTLDALHDALKNDKNVFTRREACRALAALKHPRSLRALAGALRDRRDADMPDLAKEAILGLDYSRGGLLRANETALFTGPVLKRQDRMVTRTRLKALVLTDQPRLFYCDADGANPKSCDVASLAADGADLSVVVEGGQGRVRLAPLFGDAREWLEARDASARSPGAALAEAWSEAPASAPVAEFVREASDEEVPVAVPSALPSAPPAPTASVPVR